MNNAWRAMANRIGCRLWWGVLLSVFWLSATAYAQGTPSYGGTTIPPEIQQFVGAVGFPGVLLLLGWWIRDIAAKYAEKLPDARHGVPVEIRIAPEDRELLRKLFQGE